MQPAKRVQIFAAPQTDPSRSLSALQSQQVSAAWVGSGQKHEESHVMQPSNHYMRCSQATTTCDAAQQPLCVVLSCHHLVNSFG
eukprot:1160620-Pelagomonas_calceolata.AAC.4